jgi:hypothetical protein
MAKVLLECVPVPPQNKLDHFVRVVETAAFFFVQEQQLISCIFPKSLCFFLKFFKWFWSLAMFQVSVMILTIGIIIITISLSCWEWQFKW